MTINIYSMVSAPRRHCFNWTISEKLRLEREYDLLELDVNTIAKMHSRSVDAIVHQLETEGIVGKFADARGYENTEETSGDADQNDSGSDSDSEYQVDADENEDEDDDDYDDVDDDYQSIIQMNKRLQQRVAQLETTISLMKKSTKRKPLRSYLY